MKTVCSRLVRLLAAVALLLFSGVECFQASSRSNIGAKGIGRSVFTGEYSGRGAGEAQSVLNQRMALKMELSPFVNKAKANLEAVVAKIPPAARLPLAGVAAASIAILVAKRMLDEFNSGGSAAVPAPPQQQRPSSRRITNFSYVDSKLSKRPEESTAAGEEGANVPAAAATATASSEGDDDSTKAEEPTKPAKAEQPAPAKEGTKVSVAAATAAASSEGDDDSTKAEEPTKPAKAEQPAPAKEGTKVSVAAATAAASSEGDDDSTKAEEPTKPAKAEQPAPAKVEMPTKPSKVEKPTRAPPVEKAKVTATQPNSSSSGARRIKDFSYVDSKLSKTAGSDEVKPAKTEKPKPANTSRTEMASEEMKKVVFDQSLVRRKALNNFDHLDRYIVKGDEEEQETKK